MKEVLGYETFTKIEPLEKGWSSDKKYYIETADGKRLLLRVADISEYDRKKKEFGMIQRALELDIPMSQPLDFGTCNEGKSVYQLLTWIDGKDAEEALPLMPRPKQYEFGIQAGRMLSKMQTLKVLPKGSDWLNRFGSKMDSYIANYKNCGLSFDSDDLLIEYIQENRRLLDNRQMCFTHDDYHLGNMIVSPENELYVIDFQRFRMVEPYHGMSGLVFSAKTSPFFASGQINGYFDDNIPEDFWRLLALYLAAVAVNALPWSIPYGQKEIDFAYRQIADILGWYNNMQDIVPSWYLGRL